MSKTGQWRSSAGSTVVAHLPRSAACPAHAPERRGRPGSGSSIDATVQASVNCSQADLTFALALAVLTVFAAGAALTSPGAPRRRTASGRAIASPGERRARGDRAIFRRAGTALFMAVACRAASHRSPCGAGVLERRLAGLRLRGLRVCRLDRHRRGSRAQAPGAAAVTAWIGGAGRAEPTLPDPFAGERRRTGGSVRRRAGSPGSSASRLSPGGYSPSPWRPGDRPALRPLSRLPVRGWWCAAGSVGVPMQHEKQAASRGRAAPSRIGDRRTSFLNRA